MPWGNKGYEKVFNPEAGPARKLKQKILVLLLGYGIAGVVVVVVVVEGQDWGEFVLSRGCGLEGGLQRRAFVTLFLDLQKPGGVVPVLL